MHSRIWNKYECYSIPYQLIFVKYAIADTFFPLRFLEIVRIMNHELADNEPGHIPSHFPSSLSTKPEKHSHLYEPTKF